jgi:hypothetical protein
MLSDRIKTDAPDEEVLNHMNEEVLNQKESRPDTPMCSRRRTSRELIEQEIDRLQSRVMGLRRLLDALPAVLPHYADEVLSDMVERSRC